MNCALWVSVISEGLEDFLAVGFLEIFIRIRLGITRVINIIFYGFRVLNCSVRYNNPSLYLKKDTFSLERENFIWLLLMGI